jgi:phosphoglucosamine mutase
VECLKIMVSSITRTQGWISEGSPTKSEGLRTEIESNSALNLIPLPASPLFGTDGIRGKVGELLNAPLALQVGFWAGIILRNHAAEVGPVIVGQDSRNSSDMLAMALSAGLTAAGLEVWYLGLCPTPCVAYLASKSGAIGGMMISASHNPPEDNGIKIFGADGAKLSLGLQAEIEAGLRGKISPGLVVDKCGRHYSRKELIGDYSQALQQPFRFSLGGSGWVSTVGICPNGC